MAFNYFSKQLVDTDKIDLSQVFPDKQRDAMNKQRVSYGLQDIVVYIKDATEDFRFYDPKYAELDNGIREIIDKWYKSTGETNPFDKYAPKKGKTPEYKEGVVPKEPIIVDAKEQTVKAMGVTAPKEAPADKPDVPPMPPPFREKDVDADTAVKEITKEEAEALLMQKIDKFKKELDNRQFLIDDYVDSNMADEKEDMLNKAKKNLQGIKDLIEDDMADDFDKKRYEMLADFIQKNS